VVNVASYWAGGLQLNDLEFRFRRYDNDTAYRQSKQADRMLTRAFATHFANRNVTVNSCHPGDVRSKLSGVLGFGGYETPVQGAATPLYLATSPDVVTRVANISPIVSSNPVPSANSPTRSANSSISVAPTTGHRPEDLSHSGCSWHQAKRSASKNSSIS
jgi:NAD(P)-dependent dehydrogenase (short-subunit alcohol dehydrogenase family)